MDNTSMAARRDYTGGMENMEINSAEPSNNT